MIVTPAEAPVSPVASTSLSAPPVPLQKEPIYPRAPSSVPLPARELLPSELAQLRRIAAEIAEFPPAGLPDPASLPVSSVLDGPAQLRARLVGLSQNPQAQPFCSRLRFFIARFQGQKHQFLEILDPLGERRMLVLRVPRLGPTDPAVRRQLAMRQASFFDHPLGGFSPGMRVIPENWPKYGASAEDVHLMRTGQPFLMHTLPPPCAVDNYPSILPHMDVVEEELARLIDQGFLEGPLLYKPYHVVPMMVVLKADKVRVVFDCSRTGLNDAQTPIPMSLDPLAVVVTRLPNGCWVMKVDMTDAFYHWLLTLADSEFIGIRHPVTKAYYKLRFLPFGAAQSPAFSKLGRISSALSSTPTVWWGHAQGLSATMSMTSSWPQTAISHGNRQQRFFSTGWISARNWEFISRLPSSSLLLRRRFPFWG